MLTLFDILPLPDHALAELGRYFCSFIALAGLFKFFCYLVSSMDDLDFLIQPHGNKTTFRGVLVVLELALYFKGQLFDRFVFKLS